MPPSRTASIILPHGLGLATSARGWRLLFTREGLRPDVNQGLTLAASMLPLALLLAALAGAPASSAILSAGIGSLFCVFFGGTRISLSGAGLTSALLASAILARHGPAVLGFALLVAGTLQLITGALGIGRLIRLVPLSVLRACVFGMGLVVLLQHLPNALGGYAIGTPSTGNAGFNPVVLGVAAGSGFLGVLAFIRSWFPGSLLAIAVATAATVLLDLDLPTLQETTNFPLPRLPALPGQEWAPLLGHIFQLWAVLGFGTALNTAALDRLEADRGEARRNTADQELVGNGMATIALAFLNGLPATQLVARSALGLRLGITSRRPALVQALVVPAAGLLAWPFLHLVPLAALTGIAVYIALPLLDPRPLRDLWRISRLELWIAAASILTMIFSGMVTGLLLGIGLAFATTAFRMTRTRAIVHPSTGIQTPHQVSFSGPITFLAALELDGLRTQLTALDPAAGLVLDLRSVVTMDGNGALSVVGVLDDWRARGGRTAILGPSTLVRDRLERADANTHRLATHVPASALRDAMATNDRELDTVLGRSGIRLARSHLLAGLARFKEEKRGHYDSLFEQLADGQHPHTMFITCADSRIDPAMLMGTHPGDLFIVRTLGALVPAAGNNALPQEGAAVEYGVGVLGIRTIVVCAHSQCGAISALRHGGIPAELATLGQWSKHAAAIAGEVADFADVDAATRTVAIRQIENLLSYPLVRAAHARGDLQLHAWFYDLDQVALFEWDVQKGDFVELGAAS